MNFIQKPLIEILMAHLGLGGKTGHEGSCGITGIVFLYETNCRVYYQKDNNTHKILPIRRLTLSPWKNITKPLSKEKKKKMLISKFELEEKKYYPSIGNKDGHDGCRFHDP